MGFSKKKKAPAMASVMPSGGLFGRLRANANSLVAARQAELARQEAERQQAERRAQGRNYVDGAFGQFDDNFFNSQRNNYANYYDSSVENEYKQKRDDLARSLNQTQGSGAFDYVKLFDSLDREYASKRGQGGSAADSYVSGLRNEVNANRNSLYGMAEGGGDPNAVLQNASGTANNLRSRQFSPLGSFFANISKAPGVSTAPNQPGGNVNYGSFSSASSGTNPAAFNIAPISSTRVVS